MDINHQELNKSRACKSSYKHDQKEFNRVFGKPKYAVSRKQDEMRQWVFKFVPLGDQNV